jgi:hypothetical protein
MRRILVALALAATLSGPTLASAAPLERPIVIVRGGGWHHHGPWGGPRWAPGVRVPFAPVPVLLPPLVVPAYYPVPVPVSVPVAVPVPAVPVVPSGCGC